MSESENKNKSMNKFNRVKEGCECEREEGMILLK